MFKNIIASAGLVFFMAACNTETIESENVKTAGIWASMKVDGQQDGRSRVVVELNAGGEFGTNVVLTEDEYIEVNAAGITKRMQKDIDFLDVDYQAYIDTNESNIEFSVSLFRANGEQVVNSKASLPPAFEILVPLATDSFRFEDIINLVWTPDRAQQSLWLNDIIQCVSLDGEAITSMSTRALDDSGSFNYDISSAAIFENGIEYFDDSKECSISFELTREAIGFVDPAFIEGGSFKATQTRTVKEMNLHLK